MTVQASIFKAYDIRGKVGDDLTTNATYLVGRALADFLPNDGTVAVGYDMRPDSEELAKALIEGLLEQGRDVWNIGRVTSDMIYFAVGHFGLAGGAMVTASHNPGDDNGVKLCREEAKPIGIETGLGDIRDRTISNDFTANERRGVAVSKNVTSEWIQHALSFVDAKNWKPYKVVIDAGNGMAGAIIPQLQQHIPLDITPLYFELDGTFPNHIANPLIPENLVDLQQNITATNADFGIAFDGDGDRAVLVDENGRALSGSIMTALLSTYFLKTHPEATVLYNAICGRIVPETVKANNGTPRRTKVGHSFIKNDMRKHDAVFAGEHSGHYYFKDNFYADSGLIGALIAVQVLSDSGKTLSELVEPYRDAYTIIDETNFTVTDIDMVLARLKKEFSDADQDELDGLTVSFPTSWFNVRPSNTEPVLRLNAEATTKQELDTLVARVTATITQLAN